MAGAVGAVGGLTADRGAGTVGDADTGRSIRVDVGAGEFASAPESGGRASATPVVATVPPASAGGRLVSLDATDGRDDWTGDSGPPIQIRPATVQTRTTATVSQRTFEHNG